MTKISLHEYQLRIGKMLDDSQVEEAVAHCRHILQQYPRHVHTYRALAQALLEQGEYAAAIDLFHRVLSAEPSDFISHLGLSIVFEEQSSLAQSIWHMERAYEIKPYDAIVEQKLRELYHSGGSKVPKRIPLTQGALARLYLRGELYQNAITELGQALLEDKDRIDLEVLLAEALWRDDQRIDSVELCQRILEKLPNCISANAILAEIWLLNGRNSEADELLQRLQTLTQVDEAHCDHESPVGRAFRANGAHYLPDKVEIELLEQYAADQAVLAHPDEHAEMIGEAEESPEGEAMFGWLKDDAFGEEPFADAESAQQELDDKVTLESLWLGDQEETTMQDTGDLANLPDWLIEPSGGEDEFGDFSEETAELAAALSDGFMPESPESDTPAAAVAEPELEHPATMPEEASIESETTGAAAPEAEPELPSWLEGTSDTDFRPLEADPSMLESSWFDSQPEPASEEQFISEDDSEWLSLLDEVDAEVEDSLEIAEFALTDLPQDLEAGILPGWLSEKEEPGAIVDEVSGAEEDGVLAQPLSLDEDGHVEEELPDWLSSEALSAPATVDEEDQTAVLSEAVMETPAADAGEDTEVVESELWFVDSDLGAPDDIEADLESLGDEAATRESPSLLKMDLPQWLVDQEPEEEAEPDQALEPESLVEAGDSAADEHGEEEQWGIDVDDEVAAQEEWSELPPEFDSLLTGQPDDDLPDWLKSDQFDTMAGIDVVERTMDSLGLGTDVLSLEDANLPAWLRDEESEEVEEEAPTGDTTLLAPSEEAWAAEQDGAADGDVGLHDLEPELAAAGTGALDDMELESDEEALPDWLQGDPLDTLVGKMAVEQTAESLGLDEETASQDGLDAPDWLQQDLPESEAESSDDLAEIGQFDEEAFELSDDALPDWLQGDQLDTMVGKRVVDQIADSFMAEEQVDSDEFAELDRSLGEEALPEWLDELHAMEVDDGVAFEELVALPDTSLDAPDSGQVPSDFDQLQEDWFGQHGVEGTAESMRFEEHTGESDASLLPADAETTEFPHDVPASDVAELQLKSETDWWDEESELAEPDLIGDDTSLGWDDELSWIEDIAAGEGEVTGDALRFTDSSEPELEVRESVLSEESPGDASGLDEAMVLLEEVAAEESPLASSPEMALAEDAWQETTPEYDGEVLEFGSEIVDFDEAMTWLQELIAEEQALAPWEPQLGESETIEASSAYSGFEDLADQPLEDEDVASEWLEELAGDSDTSVDELEELAAIFDQTYDEGSESDLFALDMQDLASGALDAQAGEASEAMAPLFEESDWESAAYLELAAEERLGFDEDSATDLTWLDPDATDEADEATGEVLDSAGEPSSEIGVLELLEELREAPETFDDSTGWFDAPPADEGIEAQVGDASDEWLDSEFDTLIAPTSGAVDEFDDVETIPAPPGLTSEEPGALSESDMLDEQTGDDAQPEPDAQADMETEVELISPMESTLAADEQIEEAHLWPGDEAHDVELSDEDKGAAQAIVDLKEESEPDEAHRIETFSEAADAEMAMEPMVDQAGLEEPDSWEDGLEILMDVADVPEDPDDAMAWLEQLAARQGAPEDELFMVPPADEISYEEEQEEPELGLAVEETPPSEPVLQAEQTQAEVVPGEAEDQAPDDLEDAMAWLENLAARQGAPPEELPSVQLSHELEADTQLDMAPEPALDEPGLQASEIETAPLGEAEDHEFRDIEEDLDEAMTWLEGLAAQQDTLQAEPSQDTGEDEPATQLAGSGIQPPAASEQITTSDVSAELEEALDWLQQLVGRETGVAEEARDAEPAALEVSDQELSDTLDWLEKLALSGMQDASSEANGGEFAPTDSLYELDALIAEEKAIEEVQELPSGFEIDVEVARPLEKPIEVEGLTQESESESALESLEEQAGATLDSLIATEGAIGEISEAEPAELEIRPAFGSDDDTLFELSVGVSDGVLEDDFLDEMPEDPDAALAWLEAFVDEGESPPSETGSVEVTPALAPEELEPEPDPIPTVASLGDEDESGLASQLLEETGDGMDQDFLDNIPDDPDEAVAWLQQFSRESEIVLAELLQDGGDEGLAPSEGAASVGEIAPSDETIVPSLDGETAGLPGEDELADDIGVGFAEDLADALPDWLMDEPDEAELSQTDWLQSLPDPDVAGWLEAEDEASMSGVYKSDAGPLPADVAFDVEPLAEIELAEEVELDEPLEEEEVIVTAVADADLSQLKVARSSLESGEYDEALAAYQTLVESGQGLNTLIDDLEEAAIAHESQPLLRQLLGDAYMRNGQLQKALDNYRQALDRL